MAILQRDALAKLPREEAQRYFSGWSADLKARGVLVDLAESVYFDVHRDSKEGVASLLHAADYLQDRIRYEMAPHPKGMIKVRGEFNA